MFFVNQYTMDTTGKLTKAAYDKATLYDAKAEFFKRQGAAMAASSTVWTLCTIMDEDGAIHMTDKCVKPEAEPETEA